MSPVTSIVFLSLVAGLVLVAVAWRLSGQAWAGLVSPVHPPVAWDFSKSWASNLTVVGAILATTLTTILPTTTVVATPDDYRAISLLFGFVVVLAPFVYSALLVETTDADGKPQLQGRGLGLLVSCALTLWGVIGQLATLGLIVWESRHVHTLPVGAALPIWIVIGVVLALTAPYAKQTIKLIVARAQTKPPSKTPDDTFRELEVIERVPQRWALL